ncbi:MAG: transcription-repair coupling factor, partial [Lachnospiraceae bacterium]|nr:transcription-repair coupling factor [Lachnospiraceae bacterium]
MNNAFTFPVNELDIYEELEKSLKKPGVTDIDGVAEAAKAHFIYSLGGDERVKLVIRSDDTGARELLKEIRLYDREAVYYPPRDLIFYQSDLNGNELTRERMNCVKTLLEKKGAILITTFDALMEKIPGLSRIRESILPLSRGEDINIEAFSKKLVSMGYRRSVQAENPGEFAVRGGILDVFPLTEENPVRLELWGDTIDSIRYYDAATQRSLEETESVRIYPATEMIMTEDEKYKGLERLKADYEARHKDLREKMQTEEAFRLRRTVEEFTEAFEETGEDANLASFAGFFYEDMASLLDFFNKKETLIFMDEPARLIEKGEAVEKEFADSMLMRLEKGYTLSKAADILYPVDEVMEGIAGFPAAAIGMILLKQEKYKPEKQFSLNVKTINSYNGSFTSLISDLKRYRKEKYRVIILSGSRSRAQRLTDNINDEGIPAFFTENRDRVPEGTEVMVLQGSLKRGFEYPAIRFAVISETDIFGGEHKRKKKKHAAYEGEHIASFTDLNTGDYVIHEDYGIGQYTGLEHIEIDGKTRDYVKIRYRDDSSVYVIASNLDSLQKYASKDTEKKPRLNKLGTNEWKRTREKVNRAVEGVAKRLIELYSVRENTEGYVFGPDTVWQKEFEEMFPFEETEDQTAAIEAVKRDMESKKIMDRLICGDVGFGKTEVAIRAAFKAIQENKQVAVLVPTTILAEQHYNTFTERMKDYPVTVELLCRFKTAAEQKKTVAELKKGSADIVIGTHRLLSKDVGFKDLGLLIIDEEQRFGVTHKEKIKEMRNRVDVLSLTATPIPRTLHMSLVGIRDMSVLTEPPRDRMPIQTFVMEYSDEMVREAVNREMARGGQVFFVYNRVDTIADMAANVRTLCPEARVEYAHGQMKEQELEDIMSGFIHGDVDVLVSTTIIETGIDIPNVNTMLIADADRMGLSQLYQLRGRVGRSNRTAYAFLMYKKDRLLKESAEKRLAAIREFTDLGSGFRIAMKDLEIRGAGNVLGSEQSGHMQQVGYDLYCRMLDTAVKKEKGIETTEDFNTVVDIDMDA